ncbi:MAG: YigZ family protein [Tissierellia bacterium]|jgi:uncharacterized YigZ family protein|nr:YigZ family protein [Tissierellia bacterium]
MYKSIYKQGVDRFEVKKSVFIGYSSPVKSEDEALEFIGEIKKKHYDATHNCSAYIIGEDMMIQRFDDDGEPSGTAGIPMLEVLKREELTNIVVVATRYFGGTLLGGGGLIRAYSKTSKIAVDAGVIVEMKEYLHIEIDYDYVFHGKIVNYIETNGYNTIEINYSDRVQGTILVSVKDLDRFKNDLINLTSNEIIINTKKEILMPERNGELIND